jgi:hypothetical protein
MVRSCDVKSTSSVSETHPFQLKYNRNNVGYHRGIGLCLQFEKGMAIPLAVWLECRPINPRTAN